LKLYSQPDIDNGEILSIDAAAMIFQKFTLYPNYSLYVALVEDKIIGTFELIIMDNLAHKGKRSGVIEDIVVDNDYRSKGIGRRMMDFAMNACKNNDCYKLTLSSSINRERAHKFYEELEFKKHGYSFAIEL